MRYYAYLAQTIGVLCIGVALAKVINITLNFDFRGANISPDMHWLPLAAIGLCSICIGALTSAAVDYFDREMKRQEREWEKDLEDDMD